MKMYNLVAALCVRVRSEETFGVPISWKQLGSVFGLSDDAMRHRITTFRKKYHIVDSDLSDVEWNREFLKEHAPEAEKPTLDDLCYWPGDVVYSHDDDYKKVIIIDEQNDEQEYPFVYYCEHEKTFKLGLIHYRDIDTKSTPVDEVTYTFNTSPIVVEEITKVETVTKPNFLITSNVLIVIRNDQPLSIDKSHKNFDKIKNALDAEEWGKVFDLIDMKASLSKYSAGRVTIENGHVTLDGEKLDGRIVDRLVTLLEEENLEQLDALAKFQDKLDDNPDNSIVTRIYDFMKANDIRIHADGDILCFKRVREDYKDVYSGTMDNTPGQIVSMKRNRVNRNDHETCSAGLHVASYEYMNSYSGARLILCKVNPRDIVSIPTDYNNSKMRTCRYEVVKDITENFTDDLRGLAV